MQRVPFRQRIFVVVAAAVLPLAVMSAIALYAAYQQQRAQAERAGLDVARAMSIAVEGELRRTISVLEVLDDALQVENENFVAFQDHAKRVRAAHPNWRAIVLFDAEGRPLVGTEQAYGTQPPPLVERESLDQVVRTQAPAIGFLARGPQGRWAFPVRVPVIREGQVRYVLTAIVDPEAILSVLRGQRVPADWVVAVADAKGVRVARTRNTQDSVGTSYSPTLVDMMRKSGDEGKGVTYSTEGDAVFTAYTRSRETGWYTAVGLPTMVVEAGARHTFDTWGGGIALSLLIGIAAALILARRVNSAMAKLRESALATMHGAPFVTPDSEIREIHDVSAALSKASQRRTELLLSEQAARSAAENANRAEDEFQGDARTRAAQSARRDLQRRVVAADAAARPGPGGAGA